MIHGLGGTPLELGVLPRQLEQAGLKTYAVTLPGHGMIPDQLSHTVMEDWLAAVRQAYQAVALQHQTVHVLGMCMGALLACELAKELSDESAPQQSHLGKLILLAPTVFLDGWSIPWYHWLRHLHYVIPFVRRHYRIHESDPYGIKNVRLRAIVKKRFERGDTFHYAWVPLQSIWQLDRLRHRVLQDISRVACQTLIVHAREDEFSSLRSAHALERGIGAPKAQVVVLENSYHMVCIDDDKETLATQVLAFLHGENPHASASITS